MVLTTKTITELKTATLDEVDTDFTHVDFGNDDTTESETDTSLGNSLLVVARQESTRLGSSQIISGFIGKTQLNGNDIKEVGALDSATGSLRSRKVIDTIGKTNKIEVWIDEEIATSVTQTSA